MLKPLKTDFRGVDKWLTLAVFLGPVSALADLNVMYALVPESCIRGSKWMLHASAGLFFLLCAAGAFIAWRVGSRFEVTDPAPDRLAERTRWLALAGVVLCVFSALVIVAMEIPNVVLRSCD
jgi:hypothetical protein